MTPDVLLAELLDGVLGQVRHVDGDRRPHAEHVLAALLGEVGVGRRRRDRGEPGLRVDRDRREAGRGRVVPEDGQDRIVGGELLGDGGGLLGVTLVVLHPDDDLAALDAAFGVDLVRGELGALRELLADLGQVPGHGRGDADHEVLGRGGAGRQRGGRQEPQDSEDTQQLHGSLLSGCGFEDRGAGFRARSRPRTTTARTARASARRRRDCRRRGRGRPERPAPRGPGRDGRACQPRPRWRPGSTAALDRPHARSRWSFVEQEPAARLEGVGSDQDPPPRRE